MIKVLFCGILLGSCMINDVVKAYEVVIKSTAPAVLGSRVNFSAELHDNGKISPSSQYRFLWSDNANPKHAQSIETTNPYSNFSVIYNASSDEPRLYKMQVEIEKFLVIYWVNIARSSITYNINDLLSGNLSLTQNGTTNPNDFVAVKIPVNHTIRLNPSDAEFIANATNVTTHWYRNCKYLGPSPGLSTVSSYDKENETYDVEAFVVVSFEKIEPTTTTTSTTTTTTTPKPTTASSGKDNIVPPTSTPVPTTQPSTAKPSDKNEPTTNATKSVASRRRRDVANNSTASTKAEEKPKPVEKEITASGEEIDVKQMSNITSKQIVIETTTSRFTDEDFRNHPDSCVNITEIYHDPKKTYGYFLQRFVAKVPVVNVSIAANSWLQFGELFHLQVKCAGSKPLVYCIKLIEGPYNTTGNESCVDPLDLDDCNIAFTHLFQWTTPRTVLVIVQNDVNKVVNQVAVNFYKATKQSQLSVIVVPVSFCLVAVILVVFGVAYYIQNRNRFIIEVADFNFGESQSVDMEYKTFQARLLDSIREVIPWPRRLEDPDAGDSHSGEDSSIKYGSMT